MLMVKAFHKTTKKRVNGYSKPLNKDLQTLNIIWEFHMLRVKAFHKTIKMLMRGLILLLPKVSKMP